MSGGVKEAWTLATRGSDEFAMVVQYPIDDGKWDEPKKGAGVCQQVWESDWDDGHPWYSFV